MEAGCVPFPKLSFWDFDGTWPSGDKFHRNPKKIAKEGVCTLPLLKNGKKFSKKDFEVKMSTNGTFFARVKD